MGTLGIQGQEQVEIASCLLIPLRFGRRRQTVPSLLSRIFLCGLKCLMKNMYSTYSAIS